MSNTVHTLDVVVEATNTKYKQAMKDTVQTATKTADSINGELGKIKNPIAEMFKNDKTMQSIRNMQNLIKKSWTDMFNGTIPKELAKGVKDYVKEAQLAAGIKVYTDDYLQLGNDISDTEKELSKLREKMSGMDESKRFVPTQEFTDLEKNIKSANSTLDKLYEKKRKMDNSGKAMLPTEEYTAYSDLVADAESRLEQLIAKQREWKELGVNENGSSLMKTLADDIRDTEKEISFLKRELKDLEDTGGAFSPTQDYKDLTNEIARTKQKLQEYKDLREQLIADGSNVKEAEAFQKVELAISSAESKLDSYAAKKRGMESSGQDVQFTGGLANRSTFATAGAVKSQVLTNIKEMNARIAETIAKMPLIGKVAANAAYLGTKAFSGMRAVMGKITSGIKTAGGAFASLIQRFRNGIPLLGRTRQSMSGLGNTGKGLGGIFNTLAMSARFMFASFVINSAINGAKEGLQNLAQYSAATNNSISTLMSGLTQLKNSLATAFAPVLNVVAPILSTMIDYLIAASNAVAQFMAALTGQSTYTVAKRVQQDYAASLGGTADAANSANQAAQELQRTIMGFDEINKLDDNSGSGGSGGSGGGSGGGAGAGDMFTTETVSSEYAELAGKVKSYFEDIFKPMQDAWNTYGEGVIAAWKQALNDVLSLLEDIALTFKDVWTNGTGETVCGNILQILTQIGEMISSIAVSFKKAWDDDNRGYDYIQSIFNRFNSILEVIKTIGESLLTVWNNGTGEEIIGNILEIFTNINNTIANIRTNFVNAWKLDDTGTQIIQDLADLFNNMLEHVNNITVGLEKWSNDLDLSPLLKAFNDLTTALKPLGDKIGAGLEWLFTNVLQPLAKWAVEQAIPAALEAISGALDLIDSVIDLVKPAFTWLWENFLEPIASWTGGAITTVLEGIGEGLSGLAGLIDGFEPTEVVEVGVGLVKQGWETVSGWLSSLGNAVKGAVEAGVSLAKSGWKTVTKWLSSLGDAVKGTVSAGVELAKSGWSTVTKWLSSLGDAAKGIVEAGVSLAKSGWTTVSSWLSSLGSAVQGAISAGVSLVKSGWSTVTGWLSSLGDAAAGVVSAGVSLFQDGWDTVTGWLSSLGNKVAAFLGIGTRLEKEDWESVSNWLANLGHDTIDGLITVGVSIINEAKEWWNSVVNFWKSETTGKSLTAYVEANPGSMAEDGETPEIDAPTLTKPIEAKIKITGYDFPNETLVVDNAEAKVSKTTTQAGKTLTLSDLTAYTKSVGWDKNPNKLMEISAVSKSVGWDKNPNKRVTVEALSRAVGWTNNADKTKVINALTSKVDWSGKPDKTMTVTPNASKIDWESGASKILGVLARTGEIKWKAKASGSDKVLGVLARTGGIAFKKGTASAEKILGVYARTGGISWKSGTDNKKKNLGVIGKAISAYQGYADNKRPSVNVNGRATGAYQGYADQNKPSVNVFGKVISGAKSGNWGISLSGSLSLAGLIMSVLLKKDGGIFSGGSWKPVTAYAGGGTPSMGQMFIAREAGPELVGTIGGHTAVMNNNQIVSSVAAGVYQAVAAAMSQSRQNSSGGTPVINVYVGGKRVTDVVVEEVNRRTQSTGVCPILT